MLRLLVLASFLFISFFGPSAQAQVCSGNVFLSSQAEVDAFDCSEVTGMLLIEGADISDLSPLTNLVSVGGRLSVRENAALTTLSGLENLSSVGGTFSVFNNPELASLSALESLSTVVDLNITSNPLLLSLAGLEGLTSIVSTLQISDNAALQSISGLQNLESVGEIIRIAYNASLLSLVGLENVSSVGFDLQISHNDALLSLVGLDNIVSVGRGLEIVENDAVQSLSGLDSLTSIGKENCGLFCISDIEGNDSLTSLSELSNLTYVGSDFYIRNNNSLLSLEGIENVFTVDGNLEVRDNGILERCRCGLGGLISGEPPAFAGVGGTVRIYDNDPQGICTSPEVVLATPCEPVANEEESTAPQVLRLEAYPNPVAGPLTLRYALPEAEPVRFAVYDLLGREVAVLADGVQPVGRHEARLDGLAAGTYVVRIEVGDGEEVLTRRVTVVN